MILRGTAGIRIFLFALNILIMNVNLTTSDSSGEVTADFDLDVDKTVVHLYEESGNLGSFTVEVTNRCIHVLTIQVRCDAPGITVSPQVSDVTLNSGSSVGIGIVLGRASGSPAGISQALVNARITQVNGVDADDGRERNAIIIVLTNRDHDLSVLPEDVRSQKGKIVQSNVLVENLGNANDYFSLEFEKAGEISGYPAVDFLLVPYGESAEYPVIVSIPEKAQNGDYVLGYSVRSLVNENVMAPGAMNITVSKDGNSSNASGLHDGWISITLSIIILIGSLLWIQDQESWQSRRKVSGVIRPATASLLVTAILISSLVPLPLGTEAQIGPEFDIVALDTTGSLDPSPFTSYDMAITYVDVQLTSNSVHELVVRVHIAIPHYYTGYEMEHRLAPGASEVFTASIVVPKGSEYYVANGVLNGRVIEVDRVRTDTGTEQNTGLMLQSEMYSCPRISYTGTPEVLKKDKTSTLEIKVSNLGNAVDEYNVTVEDIEDWEDLGLQFSNLTMDDWLEMEEEVDLYLEITPEKKMKQDFYAVRIHAAGWIDGPVGGCTIVLENGDHGSDDDNEGLTGPQIRAGVGAGIIVLVVVLLHIRRKNSDSEQDDEYILD